MRFLVRHQRRIAWRLTGPEAAPLLMLAHPLGMHQGIWDELVSHLTSHFRVLSWDLPGHGASAGITAPVTLEGLADDALALADAAGAERFHFVGTSIGAAIGQTLLRHAPERLNRLVLTSTGATLATPQSWHDRAGRVRRDGLPAMAAGIAERWFSPATRAAAIDLVEGWTDQLARSDGESYARICEALAGFATSRNELAAVLPPLTLLGGRDDPATPPAGLEALGHLLDEAPVILLDNVGHVPAVEAPETMAGHLHTALREPLTPRQEGVSFEAGLEVRRRVLGPDHVARSLAGATELDMPFQSLITRTAWGELWGDETLSVTQRSMITLAILAALGRDGELTLHLKTAHRTGVTQAQLRQVLTHVATYAGVPAANHAFSLARQHGWSDQ
ncbi:bifunctional 3-oxoadipate enol-lactonase/4-carboxymuconolactone decarboxylase PcaDC [Kushneria sp. TE3]|uniref:bifunctional 3-oxoadipate enol-lactonase/4-carboxymuconolactone decarboxylase PcaDC n=1 Tax=Kushneria sp. TE3 TaxID=3449832 RepID=UPI003F687C1C